MHRTCYTTLFKYLMDKGIPFQWMPHWTGLRLKTKFPMRRVPNIEMPCSASSITCSWRYQKFFLPLEDSFSAGAEYRNPFSPGHMSWKNTMRPHRIPAITIRILLPSRSSSSLLLPGSYRAGSNNHRYSYRILEYLLQIL